MTLSVPRIACPYGWPEYRSYRNEISDYFGDIIEALANLKSSDDAKLDADLYDEAVSAIKTLRDDTDDRLSNEIRAGDDDESEKPDSYHARHLQGELL